MSKKKKKRNKSKMKESGFGLDFGFKPKVLVASEPAVEFNNKFIEANVFGVGYSIQRVEGYPGPVACLDFVAEHPEALKGAFDYLERLGCYDYGDAIKIDILLKENGEYLLGLSAEPEYLIDRICKDHSLNTTIFFGTTWIKKMDTTNPILRDWKERLKSKIFPIQVGAATAEVSNGTPVFSTLQPLDDVKSFVKFELNVAEERDDPENHLLKVTQGTLPKGPKDRSTSPREIARARAEFLTDVFPVSLHRFRNSGLVELCLKATEPQSVSRNQIEQAAMNVLFSLELNPGDNHYETIPAIREKWWKILESRFETPEQDNKISELTVEKVLKQVRLDVIHTLSMHGAQISHKPSNNQRLFARLGYAD